MKRTNFLFFIILNCYSLTIWAQTPTLNALSEWSKSVAGNNTQAPDISENDRREIGTFFLLHSMAQKGLIGKDAGICVNFKKGEEGSGDKISFGIQGSADNLGKSDCTSLPELAKATPIISQMGKFFANGCEGKTDCMTVNVTGYSDGVRKTGAQSPNVSVAYNDDLAKSRAGCYEAPITNAGISSFGNFTSTGRSSRYGQYLDIMNKSYGGDYNKFYSSLNVEEKAYFEPLYKKYGKKYNIKCDKRRVTVMDFEFKSSNAKLDQTPGKSGPSLYSGGNEFNKALFMDTAIQIASVTQEDLTLKKDSQLDQILDTIMKNNGITDPRIVDSCKNDQSRELLRYFSARINELSQSDRDNFFQKVAKGNHSSLLQNAIKTSGSSSEGKLYHDMTHFFDKNSSGLKSQNYSFPGLSGGGISSSPFNCFSAKNAIQNMMATDPDRLAQACKPVGHNTSAEGHLHVEFNPKSSTHIGCNRCGSGLKFTPMNDGRMTSVYDSRDSNFPNISLTLKDKVASKYPYSAENLESFAEELLTFEIDLESMKDDTTYYRKNKLTIPAQLCVDTLFAYQAGLKELIAKAGAKKPEEISIESLDSTYTSLTGTCKKIFLEYAKVNSSAKEAFSKLDNENYRNFLNGYYNTKYYHPKKKKTYDYLGDYNNLQNPQYNFDEKTHNVLGLLQASPEKKSEFTVGGLKTPSYFILKNCNCSDPNLVQRVFEEGEWHKMDYMPIEGKVSSSADACIVSLPVPTSCMVEINNDQQNTANQNSDPKISWLDADGNTVESVLGKDLSNFKSQLDSLNSNFEFDKTCPTDDAIAKAEAVVRSLGCDQNQDIHLPNPEDEFADCAQ